MQKEPEPKDLDPLKLFGLRVVELRKRLNWSQEALAHESGLARSYIGSVERGKSNISLINICVLAEVLGETPAGMLDFEHLRAKPELGSGLRPGRPRSSKPAARVVRARR